MTTLIASLPEYTLYRDVLVRTGVARGKSQLWFCNLLPPPTQPQDSKGYFQWVLFSEYTDSFLSQALFSVGSGQLFGKFTETASCLSFSDLHSGDSHSEVHRSVVWNSINFYRDIKCGALYFWNSNLSHNTENVPQHTSENQTFKTVKVNTCMRAKDFNRLSWYSIFNDL